MSASPNRMEELGKAFLNSLGIETDGPKASLREKLKNLGLQVSNGTADAATLRSFLDLLEEYENRLSQSGIKKWFVPGTPFGIENCPKHKAFFDAGAKYKERIFLASNRTGKSLSGAYELSCHLTGEYPDWWEGKRFDRPVQAWAVGKTARTTRDIVQKELVGPIGAWGTGMLPSGTLGRVWALAGVPQGIDIIKIKHKSGGWSTLGFKNYEQSMDAFEGTAMDVIWLDEECPDTIYNECLLRTMTTGGIVYVTFTPLKGLTPFVVRFCSKAEFLCGAKPILIAEDSIDEEGEDARLANLQGTKAVIQAGWDDAPWLTPEQRRQMLDDTPPHLRAARSKGIPAMGSGNIYPIPIEEITVEPFKIPDHYKRMFALDVGWNRTACLWAAIDPDSDTIYLIDEHYVAEASPAVHAAAIRSRGAWIPGVIDPASRGRSQVDGQRLLDIYKQAGLDILPAKNQVEAGLSQAWNLLAMGKIKVFSTLQNFAKEYMLYRRGENGKVIKEHDHLMDCFRYIVLNTHRARTHRASTKGVIADGSKRYDI